jgi:hypothetical protein
MDMMVWSVFSTFSPAERSEMVNVGVDLFKRSLRVSSSLVISAFLVGYYDEKFLEVLFSRTMKLLMSAFTVETLEEDIKTLERMRHSLHVANADCLIDEEVKFLFDPAILGSEAPGWEKLLVCFNLHYSFHEQEQPLNILNNICNRKIKLSVSELRSIVKMLSINEDGPSRELESA